MVVLKYKERGNEASISSPTSGTLGSEKKTVT
jgi:hypothetical protein